MRKNYKTAGLICAGLMLSLTNINAQVVSDFESLTLSASSHWDGSDYSGTHNSGEFISTFNSGDGIFNNVFDTGTNAAWGYMPAGFAYSNKTDNTTSTEGFSAFAGNAASGTLYAIGKNKSTVVLSGSTKGTTLTGMYLTNSTYAGMSMKNGDTFGKIFGTDTTTTYYGGVNDGTNGEDWFLLTAIGYSGGSPTSNKAEFYLADFRFANNAQDYIVDSWEWMDLSALGNVDSVQFLLTSSDTTGGFGMNTPNFFAFDDFNGVGPNAIDELAAKPTLNLYPNPATNMVSIKTSFETSLVSVIDLTGKTVLTTTQNNIDISKLTAGVYFLKAENANQVVTEKFIKQ